MLDERVSLNKVSLRKSVDMPFYSFKRYIHVSTDTEYTDKNTKHTDNSPNTQTIHQIHQIHTNHHIRVIADEVFHLVPAHWLRLNSTTTIATAVCLSCVWPERDSTPSE